MSERAPRQRTIVVDDLVFRQVYDSPASLPGRYSWTTPEADVRRIEDVLRIPSGSIGAPLWLSGDTRNCPSCGRRISWLDIVTSALDGIHGPRRIAEVILGDRRFVNTEAPHAIEGLRCSDCGTAIPDLRSFKCHNWAYAIGDLQAVVADLSDQPR
jgi:hypothetical protein